MVKHQMKQVQKHRQVSELSRFQLAFEYDKTLQEIRRDVRQRAR